MPVYQLIFNGPARNYRRSNGVPVTSAKRYITIHNTSNDASAEGEAAYAKVRTDGTSSHYYVDDNSIVQSLNTDWCANHVGSFEGNVYGISYEITGVNGWSREQWLANVAWDLLASQIAVDCRQFGIPPRRLTVAEMQTKSMAGVITHNDARLAWGATTHTDPGSGFPMDHLLALVAQRMNGGVMALIDQRDWDHLRWRIYDALVAGHDSAAGPPDLIGQAIWIVRQLKAMDKKLDLIAAEADIDPEELKAIEAAAAAGAEQGVAQGADELAAALAPLLDLDPGVIKTALAEVLGSARIVVPPAG